MSKAITKADEIFNKYYWVPAPMILAYLFDKGIATCNKITDEMLEKQITENDFMTTQFQIDLINAARELAKLNLFEEVIPCIKRRF